MRPHTPRAAGIAAALCALLVAACDSPTAVAPETPGNVTGDTLLAITDVSEIVAGGVVVLRGRNLDRLRTLHVDGAAVAFQAFGRDSARFTMPLASCEIDARPVDIVANGSLSIRDTVNVASPILLEVGESRSLTAKDLACIQLAAGGEEYALAVASFTTARVIERVLRLESVGFAGQAPPAHLPSSVFQQDPHVASIEAQLAPVAGRGPDVLVPFDDYASAAAGDTVELVDWSNPEVFYAETREAVPTYRGVVVAATAGQLIVADLRQPDVERFSRPDVRQHLDQTAALVDLYALRAIRVAIDANATFPEGAGGRVVTVIRPLPADVGGTIIAADILELPWSSNMFTTLISADYASHDPAWGAATIIHEIAHLADVISYRHDRVASAGWFAEAIASFAEDVAARMASGQEHAPLGHHDGEATNRISSRIARRVSPSPDQHSPWGPAGSSVGAGTGSYDRGARIVRFAAERLGLADFDESVTLYQRLQAEIPPSPGSGTLLEAWGIGALAEQAGLSVQELLAQSMIADLTDDLLPDPAVTTWNVPQTSSWDRTPPPGRDDRYDVAFNRMIDRTRGFAAEVDVAGGGFAYWYIRGDGGFSFRAIDTGLKPHHQVFLIRVR
ncbi:MAG TPA: hypothetical protein VFZ24_12335 [Longimicrobiales bacterium]